MFPGETLPQVKSPLDKNDHQVHVHDWPTTMGCYPWYVDMTF